MKTEDEFIKEVMAETNSTVGRNETSNWQEFEKGAMIAASKAWHVYRSETERLEETCKTVANQSHHRLSDLETIAEILGRYSKRNK